MSRIGISGHRGLRTSTARLVEAGITAELESYSSNELVGVSSLADGADAIFAKAVVDAGGQLVVIVPAAKYRDGLPASHHPAYDNLLAAATQVHRLDFEESTSEAHMAAARQMLEIIDKLIAVWDGKPARGYGGTADVVAEARRRSVPVTIVWPNGASRD